MSEEVEGVEGVEWMERAVRSIGFKGWNWSDTVHLARIDHTYGPHGEREYVIALCGRRGSGETAYPNSPRCKKCIQARNKIVEET